LSSSASTTFQITKIVTTSTITCPATALFNNGTPTACTGLVTGSGLSQALTPTYSANVGLVTATVSYPGTVTYLPSSATANLQILYVKSSCFASPVYSSLPPTKSAQNKGSNLPIKCTLSAANGSVALGVRGDLVVRDMGTNALGTTIVLSVPNAFKLSGGNYSYALDTGLSGFISGHYYSVTSSWNDATTTVGYFYIK
jgi:hypothetical protein